MVAAGLASMNFVVSKGLAGIDVGIAPMRATAVIRPRIRSTSASS
jgi:hypothetical protein